MRKSIYGIMILIILLLAACGGNEEAEDVYQKAIEAGEKAESAEIEMVMKQTIEGDDHIGSVVMDMNTTSQVIMDPMTMYQKGKISMDMDGLPIDAEIEMYLTENNFYMMETMTNTWLKMDHSMMPDELAKADQPIGDQLEMFESFMDDAEFTGEDDAYVFKFSGEGENVKEFTRVLMEESLGEGVLAELGEDISEIFDDITINSVYFELHIDKDTYDTKTVAMELDLDVVLDEEGTMMNIHQEMTAEYTGINTVDEIIVPQEVIDSAQEM